MSSLQEVPEGLRRVLADVFEVQQDEITLSLAAGSLERWDSFGHLQAILALEDEYGIHFDPNKIANLTTVGLLKQELELKGVSFE